jgi:hypothetical protein
MVAIAARELLYACACASMLSGLPLQLVIPRCRMIPTLGCFYHWLPKASDNGYRLYDRLDTCCNVGMMLPKTLCVVVGSSAVLDGSCRCVDRMRAWRAPLKRLH